MLKSLKRLGDVARHGEMDRAAGIVPVKRETTVLGAGPVSGDGVQFMETGQQMVSVLFAHIFDTKIINNETEGNGAGFVAEEAWGVGTGMVTPGGQMGSEAVIGNNASLG
jgi:hypothetical protein